MVLGGRGLGAYFYTQYARPWDLPLYQQKPLIIATGPLTGTSAPTSGRATMTARSPLTKTIFTSNSGGLFGARLKFTGYDAVIILGKSAKPIYISINEKEIKIEDAASLWGKSTTDTTQKLKEQYTKTASVLSIGQPVKMGFFARVIADGPEFRRGVWEQSGVLKI